MFIDGMNISIVLGQNDALREVLVRKSESRDIGINDSNEIFKASTS